MLTQLVIPRAARWMHEGDSLSGDDTASLGYKAIDPIKWAMMGAYTSPIPNRTTRSLPTFKNMATNGATTTIVAGRIAAEVAAFSPTVFSLQLGVNDASGAVNLAGTVLPNFNAIFSALPSTCLIIYFDPLCFGEKWPTGQNTTPAIDTEIDGISAGVLAILQGASYTNRSAFVSWRHGVYDAIEPALNTPGPGSTVGPLCRPDTNAQHANALGVGYITRINMQTVAFAA